MPDSLLPHNATAQERALEAAVGPPLFPKAPLREIWDPDRCPAELLPWLAFAMSVDEWDPTWPEDAKREVIRRSFAVHQRKGTRYAVKNALSSVGFRTDLSEWFEYGGNPHTFRIDVYGEDVFEAGLQIDGDLFAQVIRIVETAKPVRSHFDLRIGESFGEVVELRSDTRSTHLHRFEADAELRPARADVGAHIRAGSRTVLRSEVMHDPRPKAKLVHSETAIALAAHVTLVSKELHQVKRRAEI